MRKKLSWLAATALALVVAPIVMGLIASAIAAALLVVCLLVASPVLLVMYCGFSLWWLLLYIPMVGFVMAMSHGTMRRSIFA